MTRTMTGRLSAAAAVIALSAGVALAHITPPVVLVSDRDVLLELDPAAFYLTDHYRPYPAMLIRLKQVRADLLEQILEQAWQLQAPKSLLAEATRDRAAGPQAARPRSPRRQIKRS